MHGICFDTPLREWFDAEEFEFDLPATTIPADFILKSLNSEEEKIPRLTDKLVWIGTAPILNELDDYITLTFHHNKSSETLELDTDLGLWLMNWVTKLKDHSLGITTFKAFKESFEEDFEEIENLWFSEEIYTIREMGLLIL